VVLVDILVAAVVMGVALAVLVGMAGRAMSSQLQGERLGIAAMLADEQLNLVLVRGPDNYASRFPLEGACDEPFKEYRYRLAFTGQAGGGDPYDVSATIVWNESGREKSVVVETSMSPRIAEEPDPDRKPPKRVERTP
jgi:Tfp pilus assembly protein PilV